MSSKPKVIIPPQDSAKLKSQISLQSLVLNGFPMHIADRFEDFESESVDTIIEELFCYIYKSLLESGRSNSEFNENIEQILTGSLDPFIYSPHKSETDLHDFVSSVFTNCDLSLLFFRTQSYFCSHFHDPSDYLSADFNLIFIRREPILSEDGSSTMNNRLYDMYYIDKRSYYKHNAYDSVSILDDISNVKSDDSLHVRTFLIYDYIFPKLQPVTSAVRSLQDVYNDINHYHGREDYEIN